MYCFMLVVGYIASKYGHIEKSSTKLVFSFKRIIIPYGIWTVSWAINIGHYSINEILHDIAITPLHKFLTYILFMS